MIDIDNLVVDTIQNAFTAASKDVLVLSEYTMIPESFPCCMVRMLKNATYARSLDQDLHAHHVTVSYQIDIFSNKESGAKSEVKELADIVDGAMVGMKFVLNDYSIITNEDRTIHRATSRYSAIVQEGVTTNGTTVHQMYRG